MRLLLDTHIAVWATFDPDALTDAERLQMARADMQLVLSSVSVWELRLKWHSFHITGGRKGPVDPIVVVKFVAAVGWEMLALTAQHAGAVLVQPLEHRDPFDELLLIQAQEEGMRLLTRDTKLAGHQFAFVGTKD